MIKDFLKISDLPRILRRRFKSQFVVVIAMLILGFGNISYGQIKKFEYQDILKQATYKAPTKKKRSKLEIFTLTQDNDKESSHIDKIKSRVSFYTVVVQVGTTFLIIALIILAITVRNIYSVRKKRNLTHITK